MCKAGRRGNFVALRGRALRGSADDGRRGAGLETGASGPVHARAGRGRPGGGTKEGKWKEKAGLGRRSWKSSLEDIFRGLARCPGGAGRAYQTRAGFGVCKRPGRGHATAKHDGGRCVAGGGPAGGARGDTCRGYDSGQSMKRGVGRHGLKACAALEMVRATEITLVVVRAFSSVRCNRAPALHEIQKGF